MDKKRRQALLKRYVSFFAFCVTILLIGVFASVPIKIEVHSVGEKPSFPFALLFSALTLAISVMAAYSSYLYWFQGEKARKNLAASIEQLRERSLIYRLPIYNPTFLFWFIRFTVPVVTVMVFGLFLLVVFSAF